MNTIIVANEASDSSIARALESAAAVSTDIALISAQKPAGLPSAVRWIDSSSSDLGDALTQALSEGRGELALIADARIATREALESMTAELGESAGAAITYSAVESNGELIEFPELGVDQIVRLVGMYTEVPTLLTAVRRSFALEQSPRGDTLNAVITRLLVRAIVEGEEIARAAATLNTPESDPAELCALNDLDRAQILSDAVNGCNIEELFPNHAWSAHHEESAAAAYHSLAALFVRLGDLQTASECLRLSDQLEDSPRSLALKGLIALDRGEILGAVANMVSSLQQYENRKKNDGSHYLSFEPKDLERINSKLQAGLQALNKRDNVTAFGHFAEAVFNFDDFYRHFGVADKVKAAH